MGRLSSRPFNDQLTSSTIVSCCSENFINNGVRFKANDPVTLELFQERDWLIVTPSTPGLFAHAQFIIDGDYSGQATLYEDTNSSGGTAVTLSNRNRNSTTTAQTVITHSPTVISTGTAGPNEFFGGGRFAGGSGIESQSKLILKHDSKYLLRIRSTSSGNRVNIVVWLDEYAFEI